MKNNALNGRVLNFNQTNHGLSLSINNNNITSLLNKSFEDEEFICQKLPPSCECFNTIDIELR